MEQSTICLIAVMVVFTITSGNVDGSCSTKLDLQIIVDSSGSVGKANFHAMMNDIADKVIQQFDIGQDKARVALFKYSSSSMMKNEFSLTKFSNLVNIKKQVKMTTFQPGLTFTAKAMNEALKTFLKNQRKDKKIPKVLLVFTDGVATDKSQVRAASKQWTNAGVTVFAIGIGRGINLGGLTDISGNKEFALQVKNFHEIGKITKSLLTKVCKAPGDCQQSKDPKGIHYEGSIAVTKSGKKCKPWFNVFGHVWFWKKNPTGYSLALPGNKCRNPHNENIASGYGYTAAPWCYIEDGKKGKSKWELCDIPKCFECKTKAKGTDYQGTVAVTKSGKKCKPWFKVFGHVWFWKKNPHYYMNFLKSNYCRNINNESIASGYGYEDGPWCYIEDGKKGKSKWELCDTKDC